MSFGAFDTLTVFFLEDYEVQLFYFYYLWLVNFHLHFYIYYLFMYLLINFIPIIKDDSPGQFHLPGYRSYFQ